MSNAAIPITQKFLVNAGGWPAMKAAQRLHEAGRVVEANYEPPILSGLVRDGLHNLRSGLRVKTFSDVENICTCRESRAWGKICAHSLAVGLAQIEAATKPKAMEPARPRAEEPPAPAPHFVEIGAEETATPIALHFILPPNFESAWAKGQLMLVTEIERSGQRAMPTTLSPNETYACDNHDLAALDFLGAPLAMQLFSREQFLHLLGSLRGHPRVAFGKTKAVSIAIEAHRPLLHLSRDDADSVTLKLAASADERLLVAGQEAWMARDTSFLPLPENLPDDLQALAEGSITLRGERAQKFLISTAPHLKAWFEVESDFVLPEVRYATPKFALNLEGSLREVRAELRATYADGSRPLGFAKRESEPSFVRDPAGEAILLRDADAEDAAVQRLSALGFGTRGERFILQDEDQIARFFAFEVPRLKKTWEIQLSAQASKASSDLQPLTPTMEVVGSGVDWFELRYSLGTADGEMFSATELQRLLRSGQSKTRLRSGRTAVFDSEAISDFEEVLRDCDPRQNQPGTYRIDRSHASYLAQTAQDLGAALRGLIDEKPIGPLALGDLEDKLRSYQRAGVEWLVRLARNNLGGILADEMGLGKTVQTLAFLRTQKVKEPALIVCPTSLLTNWENEARRFTPELKVLLLDGPDRHARFAEIPDAQIVLTSYALLQRDAEEYEGLQFSSAILDEAQHIKNPDTQNAQAAFSLRAKHRFVLTGTPMENSVRDLWSLMNFVQPGYLGIRVDFRERYEQPMARGPAPEVQRRLARRMRPFLLRRKKSEVEKDLPEKIEQLVLCDLTAPQRAAYNGLLREIQTGLTTGTGEKAGVVRMKMLVGLLRLRQVCCDLRLLNLGSAGDLPAVSRDPRDTPEVSGGTPKTAGEVARAPQKVKPAESAKLNLLDELLEEAIDGDHRVLIFSQFVSMLTLLREHLNAKKIPFAYLDGQTKNRQAEVDKFQTDDAIPVFLMSLKAGGVGLNLAAADTVIHFDPWWNYAAEAQATDRAHRIGQTRVVTAYKLIARDTVEEKIVKLQTRKREASEGVIGSEEPLMSGLTTEDLEELLA
ncbi:MAG: SNF2-related protein [Chthoniobacterales bacterium]